MHVKFATESARADTWNRRAVTFPPQGLTTFRVTRPSDPGLQKQADAVNRWSTTMRSLLTDRKDHVANFSLEEASLYCALGLPGAEELDIKVLLNQFVQWCDLVRKNTEHWLPRYYSDPKYAGFSLAEFKVAAMTTVLQKSLGACYNTNIKQEGYHNNRDSRVSLIHGLLTGHGGACVAMPTLVVAIGRRLGYPLHLVEAMEHYFVRWEDPQAGERFNFDATSPGFTSHDDEHFANYPKPIPDVVWKNHPRFLKNLAHREEIAGMIEQRAHCLTDNLRLLESLIAYEYANAFDPGNFLLETNWKITIVLAKAMNASGMNALRLGKRHYPVRDVRIQPPTEFWEPPIPRLAQQLLNDLTEIHGEDHMVQVE